MQHWLKKAVLIGILSGVGSPGLAHADTIKIGLITALTGPGSSIGIPYEQGAKAGQTMIPDVQGNKLELIVLDDATDPSSAARNARKLTQDNKVDILIGSSNVPATFAALPVAREAATALIGISPASTTGENAAWYVTTAQSAKLMISAVVGQMKRDGVKTVGYIGFSDAWGDLVYDNLVKEADSEGIKVVSNERYARSDSSVNGQILKIIAKRPDAVMTGGAGTPGALPYLALKDRNFKGKLYGAHSLINPDFIRVAGSSAEGLVAPTGPVIVAEQLPPDHPVKQMSGKFHDIFQKTNGKPSTDAYSAYAFDAWLIAAEAAKKVIADGKTKPGTPAFREALRDAIMSGTQVAGTHGVYTFKHGDSFGSDERGRVLVRLEKGKWKYIPEK